MSVSFRRWCLKTSTNAHVDPRASRRGCLRRVRTENNGKQYIAWSPPVLTHVEKSVIGPRSASMYCGTNPPPSRHAAWHSPSLAKPHHPSTRGSDVNKTRLTHPHFIFLRVSRGWGGAAGADGRLGGARSPQDGLRPSEDAGGEGGGGSDLDRNSSEPKIRGCAKRRCDATLLKGPVAWGHNW